MLCGLRCPRGAESECLLWETGEEEEGNGGDVVEESGCGEVSGCEGCDKWGCGGGGDGGEIWVGEEEHRLSVGSCCFTFFGNRLFGHLAMNGV